MAAAAASASAVAGHEVINWEDAMQQCGDDEEFLRELLVDLRSELETQVGKITQTIQNPQEAPYHAIMRAAHVIKGAAANLMCTQLRMAAMNLEQAASAANEAERGAGTLTTMTTTTTTTTTTTSVLQQQQQHHQPAVQQYYMDLQVAGQNYVNFLNSIGL